MNLILSLTLELGAMRCHPGDMVCITIQYSVG